MSSSFSIGGQHLWARGYFCATVGNVDEETIRNYIANQFSEEKNDIFRIEFSQI
ncbi:MULTISPECIES: transposase [unclassified Oceanobacillus]|uniref:transposase n=1 Tax=unclassified Oceanobacillus TaxID=2630292 RepID=UPI003FA5343D